jgi:hypothetical protein
MGSLLQDIRDSGLRNLSLSLILIAAFIVFLIMGVSAIIWGTICSLR